MATGNRRRRLLRRKQKARELRARCVNYQRIQAHKAWWNGLVDEDNQIRKLRELNHFKNSQMPMRDPNHV